MARLSEVQLERAATIVAETTAFTIPEVAQRNRVTGQTVRNYLKREQRDEAFAARCAKKRSALLAELERQKHDWADDAVRCLRRSFQKLEELIDQAKPDKGVIREIAGAVKIVGELQVVRTALSGEQSRSNHEGSAAPEGAEHAGGGPPGDEGAPSSDCALH